MKQEKMIRTAIICAVAVLGLVSGPAMAQIYNPVQGVASPAWANPFSSALLYFLANGWVKFSPWSAPDAFQWTAWGGQVDAAKTKSPSWQNPRPGHPPLPRYCGGEEGFVIWTP